MVESEWPDDINQMKPENMLVSQWPENMIVSQWPPENLYIVD